MTLFPRSNLEAIARALGDSNNGLRVQEIVDLLHMCGIENPGFTMSKQARLLKAFVANQRTTQSPQKILNFITEAMAYIQKPDCDRYEIMRNYLNHALSFGGLEVTEEGKIIPIKKVKKPRKAAEKYTRSSLHENLTARGIHSDVLKCCTTQLVAENYVHAALEVAKSIAYKLRSLSKSKLDGVRLAKCALAGKNPKIAINDLQTPSKENEQEGFLNLIEGIFRMFRNPAAHESASSWEINKADMEDVLSIASLIHRRLDTAVRQRERADVPGPV